MSRRLNLWDFDDTLAWSNEAVSRFMAKYPDVQKWKWWHDEKYSTEAALETLPIEPMWKVLGSTPGDHWILTGRVEKAVREWIKIWSSHPDLGRYVSQVENVISTSGNAARHIDVALKKQAEVEKLLRIYDEIHVYDDRSMNLETVSAVGPQVYPHLVDNGRILTANVNRDAVFKDLQIIGNALTSIQGLEMVSDKGTYKELFRSTIGIIRRIQSDLVERMSTAEVLDYVTEQLGRGKIDLKANLQSLAGDLDKGHQVDVAFRFDRKLKDFYGRETKDIHRAVYSMGLNIETAFDKLQSPIVCKVGKLVYGDGRLPVGYEAVLWRMEWPER